MKYVFRAFRAVDDYESAKAFHDGHTKILTELGINSLTSSYPIWMEDPNVIVINVTQEDGEVVGGIRVHRFDGTYELPIVSAIKEQDSGIVDFVNSKRILRGVAESCGLWNSKRVFGRGLSPLLARSSVSLTSALDVECLVCFSAPYTLKMIKSLGFNEISSVGDNGKLPYPTEKFISTALYIENIYDIQTASTENHARINSLINEPVQKVIENSQGKDVEVEYNLLGRST